MENIFNTNSKDINAISKTIEGLNTLKQKLRYYNDNYKPLIITSNQIPYHKIYIRQIENSTIFCLCDDCRDNYSKNDFDVYRDFINTQTDEIVKYFGETDDYKAKLEKYYQISGGDVSKSILSLKYVPNKIDEVKDFYGYKEVNIDVTPQTGLEFEILIDFLKEKIIFEENIKGRSKLNANKGTDSFNPYLFTYEYRVAEVNNYLELLVDEVERKNLIKRYLEKIAFDKADTRKIDKRIRWSNDAYDIKILKVANEIIQKKDVESIVDKRNFNEVEIYILALETLKFRKFLNELLVANTQQTFDIGIKSIQNILDTKKQEMYVSPLAFSIFTQTSKDYVLEFNQKESLISRLILEYELEMYKFYKDVAHYKFNGRNYKDQFPQEYYDNLEIEVQIFEGCNIKSIYDNCFEIVEFLESKCTPVNYLPHPVQNNQTSIEFFTLVNQSLVSELDILNFIERITNNEFFKLEVLAKDIETFEINFICDELVESWIGKKAYNPKSVSDLFKKFKEIVSQRVNKIPQQPNILTLANSIFIGTPTLDNVNTYIKLHIVEPYVDYSYLFQRLLNENLMLKMKHLDFVNWLYDNGYINESIKDLIIKNNGFRSLRKSFSTQRENNFNNVFNL